MSENIKSYRIRTNVGEDSFVSVNLEQDYDSFDILSLTINTHDVYKLHNSNYGVIVGRVLANNGFGIPNAKISVFIEADAEQREELSEIYSYRTTADENKDGVRYNLLPDNDVADCHQIVGTFPNKRYVLDNEDIIEVFDKYFKYTTRTNSAGDYIICGVPTGTQTLHMDLDLSDCGILSQKPRDFVYKGYTIEQFENPNMFKTGTSLSSLSQIFTQDQNVYVQPFWGNDSLGETIGITRADINVEFKFEPTCVFMGCVVSDNSSNGISKKCIPTEHMGDMDELTTGEGNIEMIRKTYSNNVEEFRVRGTELINGGGVWCYQIPMNLDYVVTDEYGSIVPTDNPDKGIPTRARVRFRISLHDMEENTENFFRPKVLVPHNPQEYGNGHDGYDYNFGTATAEESFRDLYWNNVYTVKSYIPRFQKKAINPWKTKAFSGIKGCQMYGKNNPIPYNNIRIILPLIFQLVCIIVKAIIGIVGGINRVVDTIGIALAKAGLVKILGGYPLKFLYKWAKKLKLITLSNGLCPDLENWYFAPILGKTSPETVNETPKGVDGKYDLLKQTLDGLGTEEEDSKSIDAENEDTTDRGTCLTSKTDYLISCLEMNLAQEYRVINFDFYNDWVNGMIYIPRFMREVRKKIMFLGIKIANAKLKSCMDNTRIFSTARRYTQMCALSYAQLKSDNYRTYSKPEMSFTNHLHKNDGTKQVKIFGTNGGIVHEATTMVGQHVYYLKPCEWRRTKMAEKINLFATDIVLLGSLNSCDPNGVPQAFKHLVSSSYIMPTNLALTNLEEIGAIYAYGESGTICSKNNQSRKSNIASTVGQGVNALTPSTTGNPLEQEYKFYEGTSLDENHEGPNDTIAITEAAGISWNFTGPGQGEINKSKYYYPGGHFLGLSCFDSQTNIKSCLNLERICEIGTNMSQRKESVRSIESGTTKLLYEYEVPTGLISGNDIVDEDFRSMFATMNKERLQAGALDTDTGYQIYRFVHLNPTNFNGELNKYTAASDSPYNQTIEITDESGVLEKYGVDNGDTRDDFDIEESAHTLTKTIEDPSVDYYLFRMGLNYSDLIRISDKHKKRFAITDNEKMIIPQYENSYYFYFGLQNGLTALDEFNKQFFSECPTKNIADTTPSVNVVVGNFNLCSGNSMVYVQVQNLAMPYSLTITRVGHETPITGDPVQVYQNLWGERMPYGDYTLSVVDKDGNEFTEQFSVGENIVEMTTEVYNITKYVPDSEFPLREDRDYEILGGYVEWNDISWGSTDIIDGKFIILQPDNEIAEAPISFEDSGSTGHAIFVSRRLGTHKLSLEYTTSACDSSITEVVLDLGEFTIERAGQTGLIMGIGPAATTLNSDYINNNWVTTKQIFYEVSNADSLQKWMIRKCIINPYSGASETFSSRVTAENGQKAIWMRPQNETGCFEILGDQYGVGSLRTNLNYDEIPDGYTVDDDATYWSASTPPIYAVAYNENNINMVDYVAKASGSTNGVKDLIDVGSNSSPINDGAACVFKPFPNGPLFPCRFGFGNPATTIHCIGDVDAFNQHQTGLVYPTVCYPIYKKPFTVNANFYFHQTRVIYPDNIEDRIPYLSAATVDSEDYFFRNILYDDSFFGLSEPNGCILGVANMKIKNGVTFNGGFGGESYIGLSTNFTAANAAEFKNKITTTQIMAADSTTNREPVIVASRQFPEDMDTGYEIVEGYPHFMNSGTPRPYRVQDSDAEIEKNALYEGISERVTHDSEDINFYSSIEASLNHLEYKGNNYAWHQVVAFKRPFTEDNDDIDYYVFSESMKSTTKVLKRDFFEGNVSGYPYSVSAITHLCYVADSGYTYARTFSAKYTVGSSNYYYYAGPASGTGGTLYFRKSSESSYSTNANAVKESAVRALISGNTGGKVTVCYYNTTDYPEEQILSYCLQHDNKKITFGANGWALIPRGEINSGDFLIVGVKKYEGDKCNGNICRIYHEFRNLWYYNSNLGEFFPYVMLSTGSPGYDIQGQINGGVVHQNSNYNFTLWCYYLCREFDYYRIVATWNGPSSEITVGIENATSQGTIIIPRASAGSETNVEVKITPMNYRQTYLYNQWATTTSFKIIWD